MGQWNSFPNPWSQVFEGRILLNIEPKTKI